jgi:hypothetical protein
MTLLTLEIENEQDTRLFTELAERLHIKIKQQFGCSFRNRTAEPNGYPF